MGQQAIDAAAAAVDTKTKENSISRDELKHYATQADLQKEQKELRTYLLAGGVASLTALFLIGGWVNNNTDTKTASYEKNITTNFSALSNQVSNINSHLIENKKSSDERLNKVDERLNKIEQKLDALIASQSQKK